MKKTGTWPCFFYCHIDIMGMEWYNNKCNITNVIQKEKQNAAQNIGDP